MGLSAAEEQERSRANGRRHAGAKQHVSSEPLSPILDSPSQEDSEAQARFVEQHLRRIFLLIYRIVGNTDDAQDLTQETFIKALQRRSQLKNLDKTANWLSRIATNTAIDFLRRSRRISFSDVNEAPEPFIAASETPEQSLLRGERKVYIEDALATLTGRERMALLLRDIEDIPADQVALRMNCSMATVRSHIANARIKFRRYWESRK